MAFWLVRGGSTGGREIQMIADASMYFGFDVVGDVSVYPTRAELQQVVADGYPQRDPVAHMKWAKELWDISHEMAVGDLVALPRKGTSDVRLGRIEGTYAYRPENAPDIRHTRRVQWMANDVPRQSLDVGDQRTLLSQWTVLRLKGEATAALLFGGSASSASLPTAGSMPPTPATTPLAAETEIATGIDFEAEAQDAIAKRIISRFHGHKMADLVEAVLQVQGYKTFASPPGKDGGVDIRAGRGLLGTEAPRVAVQVKSGQARSGSPELTQLLGVVGNTKADTGLFVSWGGFTPDALALARQNWFSLRLWDRDALIESVLAAYENLPEEIRTELAFKRVWALAREADV